MTSKVDRKALALKIFEETGIHVAPDDPLMAYIVGCDIVMNSHEQRWQESVDASTKQLKEHAAFVTAFQGTVIGAAAILLAVGLIFLS